MLMRLWPPPRPPVDLSLGPTVVSALPLHNNTGALVNRLDIVSLHDVSAQKRQVDLPAMALILNTAFIILCANQTIVLYWHSSRR